VEWEPDPGGQVEVKEGELGQQPLRLALPVRQLTQPLPHAHQRLQIKISLQLAIGCVGIAREFPSGFAFDPYSMRGWIRIQVFPIILILTKI